MLCSRQSEYEVIISESDMRRKTKSNVFVKYNEIKVDEKLKGQQQPNSHQRKTFLYLFRCISYSELWYCGYWFYEVLVCLLHKST